MTVSLKSQSAFNRGTFFFSRSIWEHSFWDLHEEEKHKMYMPWRICSPWQWFFHLWMWNWIRERKWRYWGASHDTACKKSEKLSSYWWFFSLCQNVQNVVTVTSAHLSTPSVENGKSTSTAGAFIKNMISTMFFEVTCCLQLYLLPATLDVKQEWKDLETRPQMSSVITSQRIILTSLHPLHQAKLFLSSQA